MVHVKQPLTIALLSGGTSSEREVSLKGGEQVFAALNPQRRYRVVRYDPATDLARLSADASTIDLALLILHGPYGEDGRIQGFLDMLGIPYQGSGVLGSAMAMDKRVAKELYTLANIPTPAFHALHRGEAHDLAALVERVRLPLVVKPVSGGSSIGMSIVHDPAELAKAIAVAFQQNATILLESYVKGIELTAGVLGNADLTALPLVEIIPAQDHVFFDYHAKYTPGATREICPARIPAAIAKKAQEYAMAAHRALACRGYSRTDIMLKGDELFVIETNTIPGMTTTSLLPLAARTAGISFGDLLDRLIMLGLEAEAR